MVFTFIPPKEGCFVTGDGSFFIIKFTKGKSAHSG